MAKLLSKKRARVIVGDTANAVKRFVSCKHRWWSIIRTHFWKKTTSHYCIRR